MWALLKSTVDQAGQAIQDVGTQAGQAIQDVGTQAGQAIQEASTALENSALQTAQKIDGSLSETKAQVSDYFDDGVDGDDAACEPVDLTFGVHLAITRESFRI